MSEPAVAAQARRQPRGMLAWTLAQFGYLALGAYLLLGGGILRGLWRRQLSFAAMAMAWGILAAHAYVAALWVAHTRVGGAAVSHGGLWAISLAAGAWAGAAVAAYLRRMALWELYGVIAVATAAAYFGLGRSWRTLGSAADGAVAWGHAPVLGATLLGPLWDHLLILWAPLMLMAAALGASMALLFLGVGAGRAPREWGIALEWRLARRHMAGRSRVSLSPTSIVTLTGVALGVASLITVTAVMSGYQHDIQSKILTTNAHLVLQKYGIDFNEHPKVAALARQSPWVAAAAPFAFNEAMLSVGGRGVGVLLKGIDAEAAAKVTQTARHLCLRLEPVSDGTERCIWAEDAGPDLLARWLADDDGPPPVIVGLSLYRRLGVPIGAPIYLMTPVGMAGAKGGAPRRMPYRLAGVFASGMHEFDAHLVYTSLGSAQRLLGLGDAVSGIELRLHDADAVGPASRDVLRRVGHYPYRTLDWRELNASIFMALSLQKVVMFLVLAFIVVVAAFNIASTLFMAVVEKAPQVAVLLSMGATRASIMKIFVLEGWAMGAAGTAVGVALGLGATRLLAGLNVAIAADVYMVDALTVRLDAQEVALTVAAALVICHLATLYPALRAAANRPIDLLRH